MGLSPAMAAHAVAAPPVVKDVAFSAEDCKGLEVQIGWARRAGTVFLELQWINRSAAPMSEFGLQFNKNPFGFIPTTAVTVPTLPSGASAPFTLPLSQEGPKGDGPMDRIQVA